MRLVKTSITAALALAATAIWLAPEASAQHYGYRSYGYKPSYGYRSYGYRPYYGYRSYGYGYRSYGYGYRGYGYRRYH